MNTITMTARQHFVEKINILNRLNYFFIIVGALEILVFAVMQKPWLMVLGIATFILAMISVKERKMKLNYFTGLLAVLKYNPLSLALFWPLFMDFFSLHMAHVSTGKIVFLCWLLLAFITVVCGVFLILKTFSLSKFKVFQSTLISMQTLK